MSKLAFTTGETAPIYKCLRCGGTWIARSVDKIPVSCAKCHSPWWNRPRSNRLKTKSKFKDIPDVDVIE